MFLVVGSLMASSFSWFLAFGCSPAAVLRLLWYRLGLVLYNWSSFLRRELASLRLALFRIVDIALWQRAGISPSCGGSVRWSISVACVRVCVERGVSTAFGVSAFGLGRRFLAMFRSFEMRLSCLVSDLVMGGCNFVFV